MKTRMEVASTHPRRRYHLPIRSDADLLQIDIRYMRAVNQDFIFFFTEVPILLDFRVAWKIQQKLLLFITTFA